MNSLKSAFPSGGVPGAMSSGLRQWVELDPTNGAGEGVIDDPNDDAMDSVMPLGADAERPAG